jgi:hypothetical protein
MKLINTNLLSVVDEEDQFRLASPNLVKRITPLLTAPKFRKLKYFDYALRIKRR